MSKETEYEIKKTDCEFNYQEELTKFLDSFDGDFDNDHINKITLWKVNRFPRLPEDVMKGFASIKDAKLPNNKEEITDFLLRLLDCHGVQLPMASTYLRFCNPLTFQLIDQRVYRLIYGKEMKLPYNTSRKNKLEMIEIYFQYLNDLANACEKKGVPFNIADRVFYMADKRINKASKLKNY